MLSYRICIRYEDFTCLLLEKKQREKPEYIKNSRHKKCPITVRKRTFRNAPVPGRNY